MNYQNNRDRFRNIGGKSLAYREFQEQDPSILTKQSFRPKFKTQISDRNVPDSLQLFQRQINAAIQSSKVRKNPKKSNKTSQFKSNPSKQTIQIKNEVNEIKNMLENQGQLKNMQDKLEKLLLQFQDQKRKSKFKTLSNINNQSVPRSIQQTMFNPMASIPYHPPQNMVPPHSYYPYPYPPYPYPYPPYPAYDQEQYKPRKRTKPRYQQQDQLDFSRQDFRPNRQNRTNRSNKRQTQYSDKKNPVRRKQRIRTRLRIYFFVVAYTIFVKKQSIKLSAMRKNNLKRFWSQKFQSQVNNLKNWILDCQKYSLSLILQKKALSLLFFNDKSQRVKQEKQKFIMQVVNIGINKMLEQCTPQKVSLFTEILLNLCRQGSFAINRFWSVYQIEQICISQYYGFFRIDTNLEKFLITILVFIKIFLFNMFLQPHKFDSKNFPKNEEPNTSNMKLISSVYYFLIKQVLYEYLGQSRDSELYKVGNWLQVKKQFIVECCEPLVYGNNYPSDQQYISGLYDENDIIQLKQHQSWSSCVQKLKKITQKLYNQTVAKGKLVKKNLKFKLYN